MFILPFSLKFNVQPHKNSTPISQLSPISVLDIFDIRI
nr:MAG TPA: hypothetical protein [Caudoviricetes sp.]